MATRSLIDVMTGRGAPDAPGSVDLNPEAQSLMNQGIENASRSASDISNENLAGAGEAVAGMGQNDQQINQEAAKSAQDPYFLKAARDIYEQKTGKGMNMLSNQNSLQAQMQKSNMMSQYARAALGQQQAISNQNEFLTNVYNQQEAAKAQLVNTLFQTGMNAYAHNKAMGSQNKTAPNMSSGSQGFGTGNYTLSNGPQTPPTPQFGSQQYSFGEG